MTWALTVGTLADEGQVRLSQNLLGLLLDDRGLDLCRLRRRQLVAQPLVLVAQGPVVRRRRSGSCRSGCRALWVAC